MPRLVCCRVGGCRDVARSIIAGAALAGLLLAGEAGARISSGPVSISGNLETQNILRVPDVDEWSFVQQRNTLRLEYDHALIQKGSLLGMADVSFLRQAKFFTYYRLVYDTIYDLAPGPRLEAADGSRGGALHDIGPIRGVARNARTDVALENNIREMYLDFDLMSLPVSFRLGKQQIVWGNANLNQRALDSVNALDLTWHFNFESGLLGRVGFSELRRTAWTAKMLVNLGDWGPLGNVFLEAYDIPFEFHPTKVRFLPHPWSYAGRNPFRGGQVIPVQGGLVNLMPCFDFTGNPAINSDVTGIDFESSLATGKCPTPGLQVSRAEQGLYDQNDPSDVNQVGARVGALLPYSIGMTLNYMYRRAIGDVSGTGTARQTAATAFASTQGQIDYVHLFATDNPATPTRDVIDPATGETRTVQGIIRIPIEFYMPYVHVFGVSLDYFEEHIAGVINAEMAWTHDNPIVSNNIPEDPMSVRRTDMVLAALSLDRPTWITPLNKGRVFDIQSQLNIGWQPFHDDLLVGSPASKSIPGQFRDEVSVDELEELTLLTAVVMNTTYWGGSLIPAFGWISDWSVAPMMRWDFILQYLPNPWLILETQFRVGWTNGRTVDDRFRQGFLRRRDELILKAVYQF